MAVAAALLRVWRGAAPEAAGSAIPTWLLHCDLPLAVLQQLGVLGAVDVVQDPRHLLSVCWPALLQPKQQQQEEQQQQEQQQQQT